MTAPDPAFQPDHPAELLERAARIRLVCFDVDGTLTDGRLHYGSDGTETKTFHVLDGQGMVLLRKSGVALALVTARTGNVAERRGAELGAQVHVGITDKLACVDAIRAQLGIGREAVAFMGDDLPDLQAMRACGLAVAPANAHAWTAQAAHFTTRAQGGRGAARELCDLLLLAQGKVDALLAAGGPP